MKSTSQDTLLYFAELLISRMRAGRNRSNHPSKQTRSSDWTREIGKKRSDPSVIAVPRVLWPDLSPWVIPLANAAGLEVRVLSPYTVSRENVALWFVKAQGETRGPTDERHPTAADAATRHPDPPGNPSPGLGESRPKPAGSDTISDDQYRLRVSRDRADAAIQVKQ